MFWCRSRSFSAKPLKNGEGRSLVSQSRVKNFCPFWEQKLYEVENFEFTIKSIIELIEFYQENASKEEVKLSEEINKVTPPLKIRALRVGQPEHLRIK